MFSATTTTKSAQSLVTHKKIVSRRHLKLISSHSRTQLTLTKIHRNNYHRMPPKITLTLNATLLRNTDKNCAVSSQTPRLTTDTTSSQKQQTHMHFLPPTTTRSLSSLNLFRLGILYVFRLVKSSSNMKWLPDLAWLQAHTKTKSWKASERNIKITWISKECPHLQLMNGTPTKTTIPSSRTPSKAAVTHFRAAQAIKV